MTEKQTPTTPATTSSATATTTSGGISVGTGALVSEQGRTAIADTVVSKIAGIAAREISGVHDLGGGTARAVGALRERIPGSRTNLTQGVAVEVGGTRPPSTSTSSRSTASRSRTSPTPSAATSSTRSSG